MNCHKGIQGSTPEYQKEIAKIYYAIGWDPSKAAPTPSHHILWSGTVYTCFLTLLISTTPNT